MPREMATSMPKVLFPVPVHPEIRISSGGVADGLEDGILNRAQFTRRLVISSRAALRIRPINGIIRY
jgi:hypothetical protein